jgi:gliding motility associated protien GldN
MAEHEKFLLCFIISNNKFHGMKNPIVKVSLAVVFLSLVLVDAHAQRTSRRRGSTANPPAQNQPTQQQNNNTQPSGYNPYGNVPIETAPSAGGFGDSVKKSLRIDAAADKSFINERTPLPYENLRWDDALYTERVWREIDLREKINQPFLYRAEDDNGDQRFISILLNAVKSGSVTSFSPEDDRFTTPQSLQDLNTSLSGGGNDTSAVRDINDPNKIVKYVVTPGTFDPNSVMKIRLKEEWIFDREASRMFVRIIGVAPLKMLYWPDGRERQATPMFWVYYPDLRPTLARYEVYNPKNMGTGRMTWEELFESRMFSSYVIKSTLDNPFNKNIRNVIKDPILALLEGENIKERIFNYEQDLWSY